MDKQSYIYKPKRVEAACNDGTVGTTDLMQRWVRRVNPRQRLEFDTEVDRGRTARMVLHGQTATYDLPEEWWLVLEDGEFITYDPDGFQERFTKEK